MTLVLFLSFSTLFILHSKKKFGTINNPITILTVIFFLHSFSNEFSNLFVEIPWAIPRYVEREIGKVVSLTSFINYCVLVASFHFGFRTTKNSLKRTRVGNPKAFLALYLVLLGFVLIKLIFSELGVYGVGQSLNSIAAFNPLDTLLNIRAIFAMIYIMVNQKRNSNWKSSLILIVFEIIISLMSGDRKILVLLFSTAILTHPFENRIYILHVIKYSFLGLIGFFIFSVVSRVRIFIGREDLFTGISNAFVDVYNRFIFSFFSALQSADSSGIQAWVLYLLNVEKLELLKGRSYIQALINTVILRPFQGDIADWQAAYTFKYVAYPTLTNHGYDFSFSAEAILNFGPIMSIIPFVILGLCIGWSWKKGIRNELSYFFTIFLMSCLFVFFRTDSTSLLRYISVLMFSFLIFRLTGILKVYSESFYIKNDAW